MEKYLEACIKSATAGGNTILSYVPKRTRIKDDKNVDRHHSIVTHADYRAQKAILGVLNGYDPEAFLIMEESTNKHELQNRLIKNYNLGKIESSRFYDIDELDGSSSLAIGHYEWAVSIGYVENMIHKAGAVFAPKVLGGTLFYASKGNGAFIRMNKKDRQIEVSDRRMEDAYILMGVDCFLTSYPMHNKLITLVADKARTTNSNGSCALALGLVASGKADALIQPLQYSWDWAGGKPIIEEAGGSIIFYEMENEKIKPIEKLETRHYSPVERTVGFVAGNEKISNNIMELMLGIRF
ncbi:MAG: hypothetical protein NT129_01835 [Candidatus Aenigmarchaeota archaeon]|nr:hypothetical protein [Candidatus Aenigmarchaeota archaeon]